MTRPRIFSVAFLAAMTASKASALWPVIGPLHESQTFSIQADSDTPLTAILKTAGGVPIYKLECHNGNYDDMSFINFSGDFQCALFSVEDGRRTSWNLLASDDPSEQKSDSFNRGRMTSNQIRGECGMIPEYGRVRHFRLRGMRITFTFKDPQWTTADAKQPRLAGFTFVLDVAPDPDATSAAAEKARSPWPGSPCK